MSNVGMCGAKEKKNMRCVTLLLKIEYGAQKFIVVATRPHLNQFFREYPTQAKGEWRRVIRSKCSQGTV